MPTPKQPPYDTSGSPRPSFDPADVAWTGIDGRLDPANLIDEHGYEPEGPLQILVRAIVRAYPNPARRDQERENVALAALVGTNHKGRPEADDHDHLLEIARRYHVEALDARFRQGGGPVEPALAPIIRTVVPDDYLPGQRGGLKNYRRVLERKFLGQRDVLLTRVTSEEDPNRLDMKSALRGVLRALKRLGIKVDETVLPDRRAKRGRKSSI